MPAAADRDGVRIAAREGIAVDLYLSRTLLRAEQVHLPRAVTDEDAVRMLLAGEIDAYAANKQRLAVVSAEEPGGPRAGRQCDAGGASDCRKP